MAIKPIDWHIAANALGRVLMRNHAWIQYSIAPLRESKWQRIQFQFAGLVSVFFGLLCLGGLVVYPANRAAQPWAGTARVLIGNASLTAMFVSGMCLLTIPEATLCLLGTDKYIRMQYPDGRPLVWPWRAVGLGFAYLTFSGLK
jgi:hypothetical protein